MHNSSEFESFNDNMQEKKVFVVEYVAGGGFYEEEIPSSLFSEGYAMLRSIIQDFKDIGYYVVTQLDDRIRFLSNLISADEIVTVNSENSFINTFNLCLKKAKHCYIIAPEFSEILYSLTKLAFNHENIILSIGLDGIKLATSKLETYDYFKANNLKTPLTFLIPIVNGKFDLEFIKEKFAKYKIPFVIKPDDGVGAENIFFFKDFSSVQHYFSKPELRFNFNRPYILQEYIQGADYSVSLIHKPLDGKLQGRVFISGINSQIVEFKKKKKSSTYKGGATPTKNFAQVKKILIKELQKFDLSRFDGYFGLDFVLSNNYEIYFIEINPRLTTSYVGIRNTVDINIISLLEKQYYESTISFINQSRVSDFRRLDLLYVGNMNKNEIRNNLIPNLLKKIPEMITPPFFIDATQNSSHSYFSCFMCTKSKNLRASKRRILAIKRILEDNQFVVLK